MLLPAIDLRWLFGPIELIRRHEALRVGGFSLRLQMTTLSGIVNSQTDKVIVGLVASAPVVGQLGIGTQVAEAGRLLAGAALSPIVSRLVHHPWRRRSRPGSARPVRAASPPLDPARDRRDA